MLAIKHILHPTDFSESSELAFRLACSLARDYGARLQVLHVVVPPTVVYAGGVVPPNPQASLDACREKLGRLVPPDPKVRVEHLLVEGDVIDEILQSASGLKADVIVMGTHGRTGLGRVLMGSVAERVVRKALCPVVTVRSPLRESHASEEPATARTVTIF
jgi:nucleotide-binding universal stress UspA family protein